MARGRARFRVGCSPARVSGFAVSAAGSRRSEWASGGLARLPALLGVAVRYELAARLVHLFFGVELCPMTVWRAVARLGAAGEEYEEGQARLVEAGIELRALLPALDELPLAQDVPPELRGLFDAGFAEALWVPKQGRSFVRSGGDGNSLASLSALPQGRERCLRGVEARVRALLLEHPQRPRKALEREQAYCELPAEAKVTVHAGRSGASPCPFEYATRKAVAPQPREDPTATMLTCAPLRLRS